MKIAVASSDGIMVNQHFGKATRFLIFDGAGKLIETRLRPARSQIDPAGESHLPGLLELLADCSAVIVSRIGAGAREELLAQGIEPMEAPGFIEAALRPFLQAGQSYE